MESAGTSPIGLCCGDDEHTGTESENGHIEAGALQGQVCGLRGKTKNKNGESRACSRNSAKSSA
jgi:hypothetical protein